MPEPNLLPASDVNSVPPRLNTVPSGASASRVTCIWSSIRRLSGSDMMISSTSKDGP